jgi:hypothetical protein
LIDDLEYDDTESPAIGVAPAGVSWDAVRDHIKIQHAPLLVRDGDQYAGLGDDLDAAIDEFRQFLLERGET